jgi:hypothetical protein
MFRNILENILKKNIQNISQYILFDFEIKLINYLKYE